MSPPLVLLHGFTGSPESWRWVREHLPSEQRVVALCMLGHSGCEASGVHGFVEEVDRLAAIIRRVGAGGAHIAGYSMGARLTLGLIARHEGLFERATLIGVNPGLESDDARRERIEADDRWVSLLLTQGLCGFEKAWSQQPIFESQHLLPEPVRRQQRHDRLGHAPDGLARSLKTVGLGQMPSHWQALAQLDLPVHLVVGEKDSKFRSLAERAVETLESGRLSVVEGAGHNLILEQPELVARLLTDFP